MKARVMEYLAALPPRTLWITLGGVLLLVVLQAWLLVVRQPLGEYLRLKGERATLESVTRAPQQLPAEIERTERQLAAFSERLAGADAQVAPERMVVQVVDRLATLAARHGVTLHGVRPAQAKRVLMFDELAFDIQAGGSYSALLDWLEDAEGELAPLAVAQFSIKRGAAPGALTMDLRMVAYRLRSGGGGAT